ncbi:MAG: DNA mismatch endonuclease Vsr [Thermoplasmata archaeon]|nr:DNA mismatch endonuclease Vsr [Thermoplasmata archaeon]
MADVHTKAQRSYNMSRIRGKWTEQEKLVHNFLKGHKIKHRMHPKITGNPDIFLPDKKLVVFLDGCFWHACPSCYRKPASNVKFWTEKIRRNKKNDKNVNRILKKEGYSVVRIWECQMKKEFEDALSEITDKK